MTGVAVQLQGQGFDVWLQRSDGSRVGPNDPTGVPFSAAALRPAFRLRLQAPGTQV